MPCVWSASALPQFWQKFAPSPLRKPHSGQWTATGSLLGRLTLRAGPAREDVREPLDVGARDDVLAGLVLLAQAVDELRAEDVDLAVQDPPLVGDVDLFLRELLDEVLELLVRERAEIGEGVHARERSSTRA